MKRSVKSTAESKTARTAGRGRPRSEKARRAILAATREIMEKGGFAAVTIEGIARRAGVGKPTIYRSWPNAQAVAMAAMLETSTEPAASSGARSGIRALRHQLGEIAKLFATPLGRNVTMMVAAAEPDTELAKVFRNHFILARREEGRRLLEQAMERGEIRRDVDLEVALDLIYAPIFYRQLAGHKPLDAGFTQEILRHALRGLAAAPA